MVSLVFFNEININDIPSSKFNEIIDSLDDYINKLYEKYEEAEFNDDLFKTSKKMLLIIYGTSTFINKLNSESKNKINNLINKGGQMGILSVILIEEADLLKQFAYEEWFKNGADTTKGIWIGSGIVDQSIIKLNKIDREDREEITNEFGYIVSKGKAHRVKLVSEFKQ